MFLIRFSSRGSNRRRLHILCIKGIIRCGYRYTNYYRFDMPGNPCHNNYASCALAMSLFTPRDDTSGRILYGDQGIIRLGRFVAASFFALERMLFGSEWIIDSLNKKQNILRWKRTTSSDAIFAQTTIIPRPLHSPKVIWNSHSAALKIAAIKISAEPSRTGASCSGMAHEAWKSDLKLSNWWEVFLECTRQANA